MSKFINGLSIQDYEKNLQSIIKRKIENGEELTEYEMKAYQLSDEDKQMADLLDKMQDGMNIPGFGIKDFLASPAAKVLIPKVLIGAARKAADPVYLASDFFTKMTLKNGNLSMFPEFGVMRAYDVAEGQEIPQNSIDWQLKTNNQIKVGKSGLRIQYSDELFRDVEFDIVNMLLSEGGRALARHKEQKAFTEWLSHGHVAIDNELFKKDPVRYKDAGSTGLDFEGNFNDTMSLDDYLDLFIICYNNGFTPTDLVMHPLVWPAFVKQGFVGGMPVYDKEVKANVGGKVTVGPEAVQGKIPFGFKVNLSPFAPIDKVNKTFDMFCVDRNNVGVQIVRDPIKTESFVDPARDITNIKLVERYGFGVSHEGRAICQARNISLAKSYPVPPRIVRLPSIDVDRR